MILPIVLLVGALVLISSGLTNRSLIDTINSEPPPEPKDNPTLDELLGSAEKDFNNANSDSSGDTKGSGAALLTTIAKHAQSMGGHVGENPAYGGVRPVHVPTSLHYKKFPGTNVGRAIDVTFPTPNQMADFANWVAETFGTVVTELFWRGPRWVNIKDGKRQGFNFVTGHQDHVHVGV